MESTSKNHKHQAELERIAERVFPGRTLTKAFELKEGYFNAAYLLTLDDKTEAVLKIAPLPGTRIMSYEKNIMYSEVLAMRLTARQTSLPVARIYAYDAGRTYCDAPYLVMEKLEGDSLSSLSGTISEAEKREILCRAGEMNAQINRITGERFGYPGQPEMQGKQWFPVFRDMLRLAVSDAVAMDIDLTVDIDGLFARLEEDEPFFREITVPRLVHWDLWDGNIFVKDNRISGLIDFERAVWGDPLLEFGFRGYRQSPDFLRGYGIGPFTPAQQRRIWWYDVYYFCLQALEPVYRGYETDDMYRWAAGMLRQYFRRT